MEQNAPRLTEDAYRKRSLEALEAIAADLQAIREYLDREDTPADEPPRAKRRATKPPVTDAVSD